MSRFKSPFEIKAAELQESMEREGTIKVPTFLSAAVDDRRAHIFALNAINGTRPPGQEELTLDDEIIVCRSSDGLHHVVSPQLQESYEEVVRQFDADTVQALRKQFDPQLNEKARVNLRPQLAYAK